MRKYKCIKQLDPSDCAAACVATVCKQYGYDVPISIIREMAETSKRGTSMFGIVTAMKKLGFKSVGLNVKVAEELYMNSKYPFIAHVITETGNTHFVVVHKISNGKAVIADPANGLMEVSTEEFEKIWSKKVVMPVPDSDFMKNYSILNTRKQFVNIIMKEKKSILNIILLSIIIAVLGVISACYFKEIIDRVYYVNNVKLLYVITAFMIFCVVFKSFTELIRGKLQVILSEKISKSIMLEFYDKVLKLPISFFDKRESGEVVSRFSDAYKIREAICGTILSSVLDGVMCVAAAILIIKIDVTLFCVTCIPIILYMLAANFFKDRIDKVNRESRSYDTGLTEFLIDSIKGINTIKAFNAQENIIIATKRKLYNLLEKLSEKGRIVNLYNFFKNIIGSIFVIGVIFAGTLELLNGNITLGGLVAFNALLTYFIDPVQRIMGIQPVLQEAMIATERIYGMISLDGEDNEQVFEDNDFENGDIVFENVDFTYKKLNKKLLNNISFRIRKGEHIGIVGLSGAGKTTIVRLLLNYYNCDNGNIYIGNKNINSISNYMIRENVAYISQEFDFFQGTIYDNITLFDESITLEEVENACKKSLILDFINALPEGFNTIIEDEGKNISGGQRQRIALARAFIRKSKIIILDEVTSNMDIKLESEFVKIIKELKGITVIIISHKMATIENCDKIFVLDRGNIIERKSVMELEENLIE